MNTFTNSRKFNRACVIIIILCFITSHINAQWEWKEIYTTAEEPIEFSFPDDNTGFVAGLNGYLMKTTNGGQSWSSSNVGVTDSIVTVSFANTSKGIVGTSEGFIYRTIDGGSTWDSVGSNQTFQSFQASAFPDVGTAFIGGEGAFIKLLKSADGGQTWTQVATYVSGDILAIFFRNGVDGYITNVDGEIHITNTGGATWFNMAMPPTSAVYYDVFYTSVSIGYACGTGGAIIKTTDGGTIWNELTSGVTSDLKSMYFITDDSGWVAGVGGTLLATNDGGATWTSKYTGAENFYDLAFGSDSAYVLSIDSGSGKIFKYREPFEDTSDTNIVVLRINRELANIKMQPNPFNHSTKMTFDNPEQEVFRMKIFDVSGREVRAIDRIKGNYVVIRKKDLKSGMYFYRLINHKGYIYTGKFTVIER